MNCSCYIFGRFDGRFTQYPDDDNRRIFDRITDYCRKDSQLIVHREERLMYYIYIKKLRNRIPSYVGLCVTMTELQVTQLNGLYAIMDSAISGLSASGHILDFGRGGVISKTTNLASHSVDISNLFKSIMVKMDGMQHDMMKLQPFKYGSHRDTYSIASLSEDEIKLIAKSNDYGYLVLHKDDTQNQSYSEIAEILGPETIEPPNSILVFLSNMTAKDKIIVTLICIIIFLLLLLILK